MRSTSSDRSRGVLERRPASCVFVEVVRKKFVRKADKGATETSVLIADPLALPIAKGIAGPGLLAETVVKRWCDHQPAPATGCSDGFGDCDDDPSDCEMPLDTLIQCGACNVSCSDTNGSVACAAGTAPMAKAG